MNFGYRHQVCPECQRQDAYIGAMRQEAKRAAKEEAKERKKAIAARARAQAWAEMKETDKQVREEDRKFWAAIGRTIRSSWFGTRIGGLVGLFLVYVLIKLLFAYLSQNVFRSDGPADIGVFQFMFGGLAIGIALLFVGHFAWHCFVSILLGRRKPK